MTESPLRSFSIDPSDAVRRPSHEAVELALPATQVMLAEGGDVRLALDPVTARSRYGCSASPDPGPADFSSATASTISPHGFAAAEALWERVSCSSLAADARH